MIPDQDVQLQTYEFRSNKRTILMSAGGSRSEYNLYAGVMCGCLQ
jgi:hypothetical protein